MLDSPLTEVIDREFADLGIRGAHVAALIGEHAAPEAETFVVGGVDHRPLLHAMVSGELDVDRMDYLLRDSYFAGVNYGRYDLDWLASNVLCVTVDGTARLAVDSRAVTAFEHFLLARYHMFQMVYFHPKSDIYDAMLRRWLEVAGPEARFPADPEAYVHCNDAWLMQRLATDDDVWARRVRERCPLKMVLELRGTAGDAARRGAAERALKDGGIEPVWLTAKPVLSRYARAPLTPASQPAVRSRDHPRGRAPTADRRGHRSLRPLRASTPIGATLRRTGVRARRQVRACRQRGLGREPINESGVPPEQDAAFMSSRGGTRIRTGG